MSVGVGRIGEARGEEPAERRVADRRAPGLAARGAHAVLVGLAVVGCLHVLFLLGVEAVRFVETRTAVVRLRADVATLQDEADGLQQVIDHAGDETYREELARRQGFLYPDEVRAVTQAAPAPTGTVDTPAGGVAPPPRATP